MTTEAYQIYQEIGEYKTLSNKEQLKLVIKAQNGDVLARERVILSNLKLVYKITKLCAANTSISKASFTELFDLGAIGLMHAIDKYDVEKNKKFSTYAFYWIKYIMMRYLTDYTKTIRISNNLGIVIKNLKQIQDNYYMENGYLPSDEYLIQEYNKKANHKISDVIYKLALYDYENIFSLNTKISGNESTDTYEIQDFITEENEQDVENIVVEKLEREFLRNILLNLTEIKLSDKERLVLWYRFGFDGQEPKSLSTIGKILEMSKENARLIQNKALEKIRKSKIFREYYPKEKKLSK